MIARRRFADFHISSLSLSLSVLVVRKNLTLSQYMRTHNERRKISTFDHLGQRKTSGERDTSSHRQRSRHDSQESAFSRAKFRSISQQNISRREHRALLESFQFFRVFSLPCCGNRISFCSASIPTETFGSAHIIVCEFSRRAREICR